MIRFITGCIEGFKEGVDEAADYLNETHPEVIEIFGSKERLVRIVKIFYGSVFGMAFLAVIMIITLGIKRVIKLFKKGA